MDMGMTKIEAVLPMGIRDGHFSFTEQGPGLPVLLIQRCPGDGCIEHKLVKDGVVALEEAETYSTDVNSFRMLLEAL